MNKPNFLEELFEGYDGTKPSGEIDCGEDVGRERVWSMKPEDYEKEYGHKNHE